MSEQVRENVYFHIAAKHGRVICISGWKTIDNAELSAAADHCTKRHFSLAVWSECPRIDFDISKEDGCWIAQGKVQQQPAPQAPPAAGEGESDEIL